MKLFNFTKRLKMNLDLAQIQVMIKIKRSNLLLKKFDQNKIQFFIIFQIIECMDLRPFGKNFCTNSKKTYIQKKFLLIKFLIKNHDFFIMIS
jgi:hypothetical protein